MLGSQFSFSFLAHRRARYIPYPGACRTKSARWAPWHLRQSHPPLARSTTHLPHRPCGILRTTTRPRLPTRAAQNRRRALPLPTVPPLLSDGMFRGCSSHLSHPPLTFIPRSIGNGPCFAPPKNHAYCSPHVVARPSREGDLEGLQEGHQLPSPANNDPVPFLRLPCTRWYPLSSLPGAWLLLRLAASSAGAVMPTRPFSALVSVGQTFVISTTTSLSAPFHPHPLPFSTTPSHTHTHTFPCSAGRSNILIHVSSPNCGNRNESGGL